jgi:Dyp-type peroxidase family
MAIDLSKPLKWQDATHEEQQMLRALQGNILKGHGRPETTNVFFRFNAAKAQESRRALREIGNFHVTSAYEQLLDTQRFQDGGPSGKTFVAVFLAFAGYGAIGRQASAPVGEPQFVKGMRDTASVSAVKDPAPAGWEPHFAQQIDAMILIGDMERNRVRLKRDEVVAILEAAGATIVHEQAGSAIKDKNNNGIEHFGYVDGRSQPLLLVEDIDKESQHAGIARWDPQFGLGAALVHDMPAPDTISFGSYFIFRKLEQNVRAFKRREQELATALGLTTDETREIAGAIVVGRFEDGTPVTLSDEATNQDPPNDFNYSGDSGSRCPFQAHIRKVNPRGSSPGGLADERTHVMPRRGIPYEDKTRAVHPSDLPGSDSVADFDANVGPKLPTGNVGLLFMAYNSSLTKQFVFTQSSWANAGGFPAPNTGIDPIIGQGFGAGTPVSKWHDQWDDPSGATHAFDFHGFVTMRGGEYFFAPSLSFLKGL